MPSRALPPVCRWIVAADRAHLQWNYGCVGFVVPHGAKFVSVVQWGEHRHEAGCASLAQGMRWVERWVAARRGLPGMGKRRWYDRLPRDCPVGAASVRASAAKEADASAHDGHPVRQRPHRGGIIGGMLTKEDRKNAAGTRDYDHR
jgi:hypothetical protein